MHHLLTAIALLQAPIAPEPIDVRVDPRVELFSIAFRLVGSDEFNQPAARSPYSDAVDQHFREHAGHRAIELARKLRAERGISYDAVPSLALHLEDLATWKERVPFDRPPERLDSRWEAASAREFVAALRDFAQASEFDAFFTSQSALRAEAETRMRGLLDANLRRDWFAGFFGTQADAAFHLHPALLQGHNNYGSSVVLADGREELSPCIGCWTWDEQGRPVFEPGLLPTIVHEYCHAFANPVVDDHLRELEPAMRRIHPFVELSMRDQAYGEPRIVLRETLTRAAVVRYLEAHAGREQALAQGTDDARRGFLWVPDLAKLLGEYEGSRTTHPSLASIAPQIGAFLVAVADELERVHADAPRVVRIVPENGAMDVSPGLTEIAIEFDRPMRTNSWALMGGGPSFPEIDKGRTLSFDAGGRILTVPVRLQPGWSYRFDLNSPANRAFQSREGAPLVPVRVQFRTMAR